MDSRVSNVHNTKASSVKQYAYLEDRNFPIRQTMEDNHFAIDSFAKQSTTGLFAIFDGHGGSEVVQYCNKVTPDIFSKEYAKEKKNMMLLFQSVFRRVDDQLKLVGASESGTTCCIALVRKLGDKRYCWVANLGDTRAVLCNKDGSFKRVSVDHKSSNPSEQDRVKKMGGVIVRGRVSGQLAVTRALGDLDLKKEGVICDPDVQEIEITANTRCLIIASDGLWDVCEDDRAVELTKNCTTTAEMCSKLVKHALTSGSKDNVSVLVLMF